MFEFYNAFESHMNMQNRHRGLICEMVPKEKTTPHTPNEIAVKWLESKDAGRLNVKHIIGQLVEVALGTAVIMSFNV